MLRYFSHGMGKAFLTAILGVLLFSACSKDESDDNALRLYAEHYDSNGQKAAVDDLYTYWVSGDDVRINNVVYPVHVSGPNDASVQGLVPDNNNIYAAVYPASVYKTNEKTRYTVEIPSTHQYKQTSDGKQIIENLPMVAYYPGGDAPEGLSFRHLTASLAVCVTNHSGCRIELDAVSISNDVYQLSGDVTFDISEAATSDGFKLEPIKMDGDKENGTVTVVFSYKSVALEDDETLVVQVPMLPVGAEKSSFTVNVMSHSEGSRLEFDRSTQLRDNSIARGVIGYVSANMETLKDGPLFEEEGGRVGVDEKAHYLIQNSREFFELIEAVNYRWDYEGNLYRNSSYEITEDLDLGGATIDPICYYNDGSEEHYFDGHRHTISNFNVNSTTQDKDRNFCGLFGRTQGDNFTIKNVIVTDASYTFGYPQRYSGTTDFAKVGGIIAAIENKGVVVENCNVRNLTINAPTEYPADEKKRDNYIGGVVGYVNQSCVIKNCKVGAVTVVDNERGSIIQQFGGIISRVDAGSKINATTAGDMLIQIINCVYDQGPTPLVIGPGPANGDLHYLSYGGMVATITECDNLKIVDCVVHHNLVVQRYPHYVGGLIGRKRSSFLTQIDLDENVIVEGNIDNQTEYNWSINPYIGKHENKSVPMGSPTCVNRLTAIPSSAGVPGFQKAAQTLSNL